MKQTDWIQKVESCFLSLHPPPTSPIIGKGLSVWLSGTTEDREPHIQSKLELPQGLNADLKYKEKYFPKDKHKNPVFHEIMFTNAPCTPKGQILVLWKLSNVEAAPLKMYKGSFKETCLSGLHVALPHGISKNSINIICIRSM